MQRIIDLDKQLFLGINEQHAEWLDPFMLFFSSYTAWGVITFLIFLYVFYSKTKNLRLPVAGFMLMAVASTNLINQLVKIIVARPRPIHEEAFNGIIHAVEKFDDSYSFFSAHSSSSFALAVFALLAVPDKLFRGAVLGWAFIVAYSRIYVGKHYPFDVIAGILFGSLMGLLWWRIYRMYKNRKYRTLYEEKND